MSRTVKRALAVILALAMLLGSLYGLDRILRRKDSQRYYQPFFQVSGQVAFSTVFILVFGVWGMQYDAASFIYFQF